MKTKLLLMAAAAGALVLANTTVAGDALLSPKARDQQASLRREPGLTQDKLDRSIKLVSPKQAELQQTLRKVSSASPSTTPSCAPYPTVSPKDARYENALRGNATREFPVAPLK